MSEQPAGRPGGPQQQPDVYDPPIEHDPIGQAIVGLPFALATGVGEAAMGVGSLVGEVGREVISWGAAELGIGAAESAIEGSPGDGTGGTGGGTSGPDETLTCDDPAAAPHDTSTHDTSPDDMSLDDMSLDAPVDMPAE